MYEYLRGNFKKVTPTYMVIDCAGVGYYVNISLTTYEALKEQKEGSVFIHFSISENAQTLYGFAKEEERILFRALISVSGVGPATARMILSSQSTNETINAIVRGNISLLNSIKGIGPKTAQRIIVELQDKLGKMSSTDTINTSIDANISLNQEALLALESLGFNKNVASKAIGKVLQESPEISVENLIKRALRIL
ncbi:MAG: Holliday junction branch migration protein RuvA [Bacteroidetes bacterium]|nr:Holliday junction branch migration protein RuvA [Bacteroidota bacterium]